MATSDALAQKLTSEAGTTQNVTVGVRIRPLNQKEQDAEMEACYTASEDASCVEEMSADGNHAKDWAVDYAFGDQCTNEFIFKTFGEPLCNNALTGYNTVLFMYGQTSSGKTFTLFGGGEIEGCVGHTLQYIYEKVVASEDSEYNIKLSYAELYNEELRDLLSEEANGNLKIFDDPMLGPVIQGITQEEFTSAARAKELLAEGENRRHFGVTNMNAHSSRSHVLVRLHIECRKIGHKPATPFRKSWGRDKPTSISTLNLVDLAGSERANKSGTSGQALKEGSFINKSLLTLGTVISSLSDGKNSAHIPYRDSKLTRLLASALGGNAKTCLITCISPATGNLVESQSTLRFATRAKKIVNHAQKNEFEEAKSLATKFAQQKAELDELRLKFETSKQLGFSVEGEEGETIKSRAISSIKNLKITKFFMMNGPKIVKALRSKGQIEIAKKIEKDMKLTLCGAIDLTETLEDHHETVQNFFDEDDTLMKVMKETLHYNSADALFSKESDLDIDDNMDVDVDMITGGFADENAKSDTEIAWMSGEDTMARLVSVIDKLKNDMHVVVKSESMLKKQLEMASTSGTESSDKINKLLVNERKLNEDIDSLKSEIEKMAASSKQSIEERNKSIENLKNEKKINLANIKSLQESLQSTKSELDETKSTLDRVRADLSDSDALRKSFEEALHKTRNDMRAQNDKLRNNMKLIMQEGGDETKVLEQQNSELQQENNRLKDEIEITKQTQVKLGNEIQILRSDSQRAQDHVKECIDENLNLNSEVVSLQQQVQEGNEVNSGLLGKTSALEMELVELRRRWSTETKRYEQSISDALSEFESKLKSRDEEIYKLSCRINELSEENTNEKSATDTRNSIHLQEMHAKNEEIAFLEKAMSETTKNNNKLSEQTKKALSMANESIASLGKERDQLTIELELAKKNASLHATEAIAMQDTSNVITSGEKASNGSYHTDNNYEDSRKYKKGAKGRESDHLSSLDVFDEDYIIDDEFRVGDLPKSDTMDPDIFTEKLYEEYLEKRLTYMKEVEYSDSINNMNNATSDIRYIALRDAMNIARASLRFVIREDMSIRDYLVQEGNNKSTNIELHTSKIANLEMLLSSYSEAHTETQKNADEGTEKVLMLQEQVDELRQLLHDSKIEVKEAEASDRAKISKILEISKDIENMELFVIDSKAEVEMARKQAEDSDRNKEEALQKLKNAEKDIEELESRYDRLYRQASVIEKERADIVAHVINNSSVDGKPLSLSASSHLPLS